MGTILQTYPLICPQIPFKDRFGNQNAFLEMNPAIWFDEITRLWTVLVRGVNYRKFINSTFTLYHSPAHSVYWIGEGYDLNELKFRELKYDFGNLKWYSTYWNGVEDIRFLDKDNIIACVPQLNPGGGPALFKATISRETSLLHSFQPLQPSERPEKNWLPFPGGNLVLYSCCPLNIKTLETDSIQEIPVDSSIQNMLEGYHGSTNGIQVKDYFLFLIHKNNVNGRTVHRWLKISNDFKTVQASNPFTFFNHSYIEFPCGLVYIKSNNKVYVSLGVNDDKAYVIEVAIWF
jgi:hypothetical protein